MRTTLVAGTALLAAALNPLTARADYPEQPVEVVVTFAPGGAPDVLARALVEDMSSNLKQPFIVVNRLGASGAIGGASVARAKPDGYTLLFSPALIASVVPVMQPTAGFTAEAFEPVCQTFESQMALVVAPDSPLQSVKDVVAAARKEPGKLTYGHAGVGSIPHLTMLQLAKTANINVVGAPYKGDSDVLPSVIGKHLDFAPMTLGSVAGGQVKIIGLFAQERNPAIPDVPTVKEQGFDVTPTSFGGLFAPAKLPQEVKQKLQVACEKAANSTRYLETAKKLRLGQRLFLPADQFEQRLKQDIKEKADILSTLK